MESKKRKLSNIGGERRVRARAEPEPVWDDIDESSDDTESPSEAEIDHDDSTDESGSDSGDESLTNDLNSEEDATPETSTLSLGALARRQASLPSRRKKGNAPPPGAADPDDQASETTAIRPKPHRKAPPPTRPSKHAPTETTSKRRVSRLRPSAAADPAAAGTPAARDPRFSALHAPAGAAARLDAIKATKNYAFLDGYRAEELAVLKCAASAGTSRAPAREREELAREVRRLESRALQAERVRKAEGVVAEHRRREKELVRMGKKPFYLKKAEQKKRLLVDRFAGMSEKQADKTMARREKKMAGKEKKERLGERRYKPTT